MTIGDFIQQLQEIRPNYLEIKDSLDEFDEDLIKSIIEMFDYWVNNYFVVYNSVLLNCIHNTNVVEKGLTDFYFVSTESGKNFAYTDSNHQFFLEESMVYAMYEGDYKLVSTSEVDFLHGMISCFKANIDFSYRRNKRTLNDSIFELISKVPNNNSEYFVQRLRELYSEW